MSLGRFVDCVFELYQANLRFCFVLGAGASKTSGIRTGEELMREWFTKLHKDIDRIKECAKELSPSDKGNKYNKYFNKDYKLSNEDYFDIFDLRFCSMPRVGQFALIKEMQNKYPSYGYYPLSKLLTETENKLVITTNFDSLTEDSVFIYSLTRPLVLGHESLASYISEKPTMPVIAKIHRDLYFDPLNRQKDLNDLKENWKVPLKQALKNNIPIIIGYAGGDRTFMSLLEDKELTCENGLFWCYVGKEPSKKIQKVVAKHNGWLVKIDGFDEIMFMLALRFSGIEDIKDFRCYKDKRCIKPIEGYMDFQEPYEILKQIMETRLDQYNKTFEKVLINIKSDKSVLNEQTDLAHSPKEKQSEEFLKSRNSYLEKILEELNEKITKDPNNAFYYSERGTVYYQLQKYDKALDDISKAIELDPNNAEYYTKRGDLYHKMKRYKDALDDINKAIELDPNKAGYYYRRMFINFEMEKYEEALENVSEAIKLDPNKASYYDSRGTVHYRLGEHNNALSNLSKAIELDSENSGYYARRGDLYRIMNQNEEALDDINKAIELDPNAANFYDFRAEVYKHLGEVELEKADLEKAKKLMDENLK